MKFCFTKDELDDTGHVTKLTSTVITKECQACIFNDDDAHDYINLAIDHFDEFIDQWSEYGSGWVLDHIINLCYHVSLVKRVW